jgi:hypothetical protein
LLLLCLSTLATANTTLQFGFESSTDFLASQKYTLFFTLDGPAGDGLFQEPAQVQQFMRFHEDLMQSFVPRFATLEQVQEVIPTCQYLAQKSFDFPLTLDPARPGVIYVEPPSQDFDIRHLQQQQQQQQVVVVAPEEEGGDQEEVSNLLSTLHGNTTYGILYIMNYTSPTINVENYTLYYERVVYESFDELVLGLRSWLDVPTTSNLSILGVYNTLDAEGGSTTPNPYQQEHAMFSLLDYNDTFTGPYNDTEQPRSSVPTLYPTASRSPSEQPTTSSVPSASSRPSLRPSKYPSAEPSSSPTVAPSSHPTFHSNSTSRGRYDFTFTMENVTHPEDLFQNLTLMCYMFVNMTPSLAWIQGQNPRHVHSECAYISGGFFRPVRPRPTTPTSAPIDPADEEVDGNNASATIGDDDNLSRRTLFLRGENNRQLQNYSHSDYGNWSFVYPYAQHVIWSYTLSITWESPIWDVAGYPDALEDFVVDNKGDVEAELTAVYKIDSDDGTDLTINHFRRWFVQTPAPSALPSSSPSATPTEEDTEEPTFRPTLPTEAPTIAPTILPTMAPTDGSLSKFATLIVVVVVVLVFSAGGMCGLLVFYRSRKKRLTAFTKSRRRPVIANGEITVELNNGDILDSYGAATPELHEPHERVEPRRKPHTEAASGFVNAYRIDEMSNRSDLIAGAKDTDASDTQQNIGSNQNKKMLMSSLLSDIDEDNYSSDGHEEASIDIFQTPQSPPPADEFEKYKDRNLEKMRTHVEGNVEGLDDMMSQAMTMALMMDGGASTSPKWNGAKTGIEIEANALWEVTEWLKRHVDPELDDK